MRKFLSMWVKYPSFYIWFFMLFIFPTTVPGFIFYFMIFVCNMMLIALCENDMYYESDYIKWMRRWYNSKDVVSSTTSQILLETAISYKNH